MNKQRKNFKKTNTAIHAESFFIKPLAFAVIAAVSGVFPFLGEASEIIVDAAAPTSQQPTLLNSANGTPQINIQTPTAAGVSRNTYQQFDIDSQGVILNNGRSNSQTQLGGWVNANPHLVAGEATVILNEINSSDPSTLNGFIEVAGQKADVIVANPAGINCDGCGFINAAASTLTTGSPIVEGGSLTGFNVQGGSITVSGDGLNTSDADYTRVISRAVEINAGLHAQDLRVVTGVNIVSADGVNVTSQSSTSPAPSVAIDVANLGGMYAGKIHLVATENGVGVNNAGTVAADISSLSLNANGMLTNTGQITAQTGLTINQTGAITNSGNLRSEQTLSIVSASLTNAGTVTAKNNTQLQTSASITNSANGMLAAGVNSDLTLHTEGDLSVAAGTDLQNQGKVLAAQTAIVEAQGQLNNSGIIDAEMTRLSSQELNNSAAGKVYGDTLAISADTLTNEGDGTDAPVIAARQQLDIGTRLLTNREDALIFSAGNLAVGGALDQNNSAINRVSTLQNSSATIEAVGNLALAADNLSNTNEHIQLSQVVLADQDLEEFKLDSGDVYRPSDIINHYARDEIRIFDCEAQCMQILATGDASDQYTHYQITRSITEDQLQSSVPGEILAGGDINLTFVTANNEQSRIVAGGDLNLTGGSVNNVNQTGLRLIDDNGTATAYRRQRAGGRDHSVTFVSAYAPADITETIELVAADTLNNTSLSTNNDQSVSHSVTLDTAGVNLPGSSLFQANPASNSQYLIETDPQFANYRNWLSSDFFLDQVAVKPGGVHKRLGDGFYEQRVLQQQITQLTGQRYLSGYTDNETQYQALMQAGVAYAQAFDLKPGIALSAEEMVNLSQDIVWLVEKIVTLEDGTQQRVLAPQLYIHGPANKQQQSVATLAAGNDLDIQLTQELNNSGLIQAQEQASIQAQTIQGQGGQLTARTLTLKADQDIQLQGTALQTENRLQLDAGNDVNIASVAGRNEGNQGHRTFIAQQAQLLSTGEQAIVQINAGRDITLQAANLKSQGDVELNAGQDVHLNTLITEQQQSLRWNADHYTSEYSSREVGSTLEATNNLTVKADRDIAARGGRLATQTGTLKLEAGQNIELQSAKQVQKLNAGSKMTSRGFASKRTLTTRDNLHYSDAQGTQLSGGAIQLLSHNNIQIQGAQIVADNDVQLNATQDIDIVAARSERQDDRLYLENKTGIFSSGGFGFTVGSRSRSDDTRTEEGLLTSSTLGSLNGNISVTSGRDTNVVASDLLSQQGDISIEGRNVSLESANETYQRDKVVKIKQSGFTVALSGGVIDTVQQIQESAERVSSADDAKLKALHAWRIGRVAQELEGQIDNLQHAGADFETPTESNIDDDGNANPSSGLNLSISLGSSKSEETRHINNQVALGSSVIAEGDVAIVARGEVDSEVNSPEEGNLVSRGSLIEGNNVSLNAANRIDLLSAENIRQDDTQTKSSSTGIGFSIGSDGLQVFAQASKSRGEINKSSDRYLESQINANNTASLTSGGDTHLEGAQVNADKITADVGGDLNIISQQDEEHYRNRQKSIGGKIGVGLGAGSPVSVSLNASKLKADSDYQSVQEQSGLFAGTEGFDVQVAQNTDLQGGAIVSEADSSKNKLSTNTLSFNSLQNKAKYKVESKSISFSTSGSNGPTKGFGGGFSNDEGEASNTTFAVISEGDIEVRANPNQSLDDLKRYKEQAHQVLERIFSEDKIDQAREQVELTQIFAEEAYRVVGDLYRDLETAEAALERAKAEDKSEQEIQQLEALIGSIERRYPVDKATAHALVGGITAVLGGGDFLTGAVAAGVSEASAKSIAAALPDQEGLQNLAAALIGGTLGGSQGALITANANQFNRQLHPNEIELILKNADKFAQQIGVSDVDLAISILTDAALDQIDLNWSETDNPSVPGDSTQTAAIAFLQELSQQTEAGNRYGVDGRWFTSTEEAFVNPEIYADLVFPQREDLDTTGYDAVEYPDTSRDYLAFYNKYAKAHISTDAQQTAAEYAADMVKDKGLAVADALIQLETYEQIIQGIKNIISSDNPLVYAAEAQLKGLQADHALKDALDAVEVHAVLAELQGDLDTAAKLRGQAAAEIAIAQLGAATSASGVGLGTAATAKLTVKIKSLAEAAKLKVADNNSKLKVGGDAEQVASGGTDTGTVQGESVVANSLTRSLSDDASQIISNSTKGQLRRQAALSSASVDELGIVSGNFTNLPGSVKNFPGVNRIDDGAFLIEDQAAYMNQVEKLYADSGNPLNSVTRARIFDYIGDGSKQFPTQAGMPGLHAEVQSVNSVINQVPSGFDLSKINVSTIKLAPGSGQGLPFPACTNCGGILSNSVNILTGVK